MFCWFAYHCKMSFDGEKDERLKKFYKDRLKINKATIKHKQIITAMITQYNMNIYKDRLDCGPNHIRNICFVFYLVWLPFDMIVIVYV